MKLFKFLFLSLCLLFLSQTIFSQQSYSKINIVSDKEYTKNEYKFEIGSISSVSSNLSYDSSKLLYYNPCFLDTKRNSTILHEDFTINIKLDNITPRSECYEFSIPIRNLSAETDHYYYSNANPKLKQNFDDIYWGLALNVSHSGINESIIIWIKKFSRNYYGSKSDYTSYDVNNTGWQEKYGYPNISSDYSSELKITGWKYSNQSEISWGDIAFYSLYSNPLPYFIDAINSVQVLVGCQANIKVGKGQLHLGNYFGLADENINKAETYLNDHYSKLSNFISAEQYFSAESEAKNWIKEDGNTTEFNAFTLAYCQITRNEYYDCMRTCNALIQYRGDYLNQAYVLRGLCKETDGDIEGALSDYNNAGSLGVDSYNKLIQKTNINNNQLQKKSNNKTSPKPKLRR